MPMKPPILDVDALYKSPATVIAQLVVIDVFHLEEMMENHPRLMAEAVAHFEMLRADVAAGEADLKFVQSQEYRALLVQDNMPVSKAEKLLDDSLHVIRQQKKLAALRKKLGAFRALVTALEHRRDMLVQIAARQRAEIVS